MPAQKEVLDASEDYIASIGGYGSGKSVATAVVGHLLSVNIPGNRGIITRESYPKLRESEQRTFMDVLQRSGTEYIAREKRDGWANWIIYPNGSEVFFRPFTDIGRYLGPEYGWFLIGEGIEAPEEVFTKLQGRRRLPQAKKYLRGLINSNPPGHNHWITRIFGADAGVVTHKIDVDGELIPIKFRRVWSPTRENPNLPPSYIAGLKATLPPSEVQRVLEGKTTFQFEGKGVFTKYFEYAKHVSACTPRVNADGYILPMQRSWDFGFHCPAVLWYQFYKCWHGRTHWMILEESRARDLYDEDLARIVKDVSLSMFTSRDTRSGLWLYTQWTDIGDAAGAELSHKGPGPIVRLSHAPFSLKFHYRKIPNLEPGIELILKLLAQPNCACGEPTIRIHPRCTNLIDALAGGYHYAKEKYNRETPAKPVKDGLYDNYADSLRYAAELGYRLASLDHVALDRLLAYTPPKDQWRLPGGERMVEFPWEGRQRDTDLETAEWLRINYQSYKKD